MEEFAGEVAVAGTADSIAQVYDQYLNFVVAEPDLFSLALGRETYWALNSATTADDALDRLVDNIVSGLFSVVVTMGEVYHPCTRKYLTLYRVYSNYSMSKIWPCGNDRYQARPKVARSYSKFKR